jgi:hypothetical protein
MIWLGRIAAWVVLPAALFGCLSAARVERRGDDLVPREPAPGSPVAFFEASADRAQLARRLAEELAQAGILVHLKAPKAWPTGGLARSYLVTLGEMANQEVAEAAGRIAIAPTAPVFSASSLQPLLLIRAPGPPPIAQTARPVWELRFDGLAPGVALPLEEEHSLIEAVVLWIRNRAVD